MAGVDTILRIVGATIAVAAIGIISGIGYAVLDSVYLDMNKPAESLGWGDGSTVMMWVGLSLIGLTLAIFMWMIFGPIRNDVRQDVEGPF